MSVNNSNKLSSQTIKNNLPSTYSYQKNNPSQTPLKTNSYGKTNSHNVHNNAVYIKKNAEDFMGQMTNTVLNGYFNYNFFKNRSANDILKYTNTPIPSEITKNFQHAQTNIQKSMNMFGLTTAISFLPNIITLCADGFILKLHAQNKAKKIIRDKQKLDLINQMIEIRNQKDIQKTQELKALYQKIETDNQKIEQSIEKSRTISNHVKTLSNSASAVGGLISANYLYKTIQDPHILPNIMNIMHNEQSSQNHNKILQDTKLGMGLYAASLGIGALTGLWKLGDYCHNTFLRSKETQKKSAQQNLSDSSKTSAIIKNTILPSVNQIFNGLGSAILLKNPHSWNIGNIFTQGGMAININSLFKSMFLAGSLVSVAGGTLGIINGMNALTHKSQSQQSENQSHA